MIVFEQDVVGALKLSSAVLLVFLKTAVAGRRSTARGIDPSLRIDQHARVQYVSRIERPLGRGQRGGEQVWALAVVPGRWSRATAW